MAMPKKGLGFNGTATQIGFNDEWLSPPNIIKSLGHFDLDPCSPIIRPWPTADRHYTIKDDGIFLPWNGRVWMNPPYGKTMHHWLNKLALHGNGIAMTFARTETAAFHNYVFPFASSIFFFKGRIRFYNVDGTLADDDSRAPSVLISYGKNNLEAIADSKLKGKHVLINYTSVIVIGMDRTWKTVVTMSMEKLDGKACLDSIYAQVERIAPDKTSKNNNFKAKIRQTLQLYFTRLERGIYTYQKTEQ